MAGGSFLKDGLERVAGAIVNADQLPGVTIVAINVKQVTFYWVESRWLATHFQVLSYSYPSTRTYFAKGYHHGLEHPEGYRNSARRRNQLLCLRPEEVSSSSDRR